MGFLSPHRVFEQNMHPDRGIISLPSHLAGVVASPALTGSGQGWVVADPPHTGAEVGEAGVETVPWLPPVHHHSPSSTPAPSTALPS